jgi:Cu(I)/Ag(I) efflux system membrane fusion protein
MKLPKILQLALGLLISVSALQAHSDAFKPQFVDTLVAPYLSVQNALAGDDLKSAQVGAKAFLKAMEKAPHEGEAHEEAADLRVPAKTISGATDIKVARTAFLDISRQMTSLIQHVGVTKETPLFTAFCPMAFNNEGGQWIQSDEKVANPYYGSMMLRCGSIKKQIAGKMDHASHGGKMDHSEHSETAMPAMQEDHSGHSH